VTDEAGDAYPDFDAFCRDRQPWGLGTDPAKFRAHLAAELGDRAADLITVAPGTDKGGRPRKEEETSTSDVEVSNKQDRKSQQLRAILRAPEVIQTLYRDGLITQADAAKLGPRSPTPERAARVAEARQEIEKLDRDDPEFRKKAGGVVRRVLGDCPERRALDEALERGPGNPTGVNQHTERKEEAEAGIHNRVMDSSPGASGNVPAAEQGNSAAYQVRRLRRRAEQEREAAGPDAPATPAEDLLAKVRSGEMKPKTACRLAGLVQPTISLSRDPAKAAEQIMTVYGVEFARLLVAESTATSCHGFPATIRPASTPGPPGRGGGWLRGVGRGGGPARRRDWWAARASRWRPAVSGSFASGGRRHPRFLGGGAPVAYHSPATHSLPLWRHPGIAWSYR